MGVNSWMSMLLKENRIKGALSGLMKNVFYFTSKVLFVLKIFNFLSCHVAKRLDKKDKANFEFYDVTAWLINNCNTHIAQYLEK